MLYGTRAQTDTLVRNVGPVPGFSPERTQRPSGGAPEILIRGRIRAGVSVRKRHRALAGRGAGDPELEGGPSGRDHPVILHGRSPGEGTEDPGHKPIWQGDNPVRERRDGPLAEAAEALVRG